MITINAIGDTCPIPVVKTKKAIEKLEKPDTVETLVDNEIAVENLKKMASQMGFAVSDSKINSGYSVKITVEDIDKINDNKMSVTNAKATSEAKANSIKTGADDMVSCNIKNSGEKVVVIKSEFMGDGDNELGKVLIKGFIYALSQQDELPQTMLFYNGGAKITSEGSESIEDLKALEEKGVKIFTCGTCLNYYGLTEKLCVGEATNMYEITKKMTEASLIVCP
ncbi:MULTISPECIES: sulfurtransferase-like selenium metabolism protein YedF [Clostridia]|uniref:Response regulator SirA n=1 Tax=Butyribacter intestini TaxID=1703332 RepID=A0AAW3JW76_9FIRM|nr:MULTISPECIES: sulfurtransferase-like selenium metabolism protein YedF [Clostridia]KQC86907.1 response regulator SirA [Butyribacter intestini]RHP26683.1 sulfurtransferase-like selenium metabolism protein YedF [Clostridium sp. AF34-13]RHU78012.1 sulfurtransferase-like selenium metabolism protein YedF [Butyribacter intestini]